MTTDLQSFPSALTVVGDRDYIQGIAILDALADSVAEHLGGASIERIHIGRAKFNFKTLNDGHFVVSFDPASPPPDGQVSAEIEGETQPAGDMFKGYFVPNSETPASNRITHDDLMIDEVQSDQNNGGQCRVQWQGQTQFLKTLVEANKRVILAGRPAAAAEQIVDIVYLENLSISMNTAPFSGVLSVHNMSARGKTNDLYIRNELSWGGKTETATRFVFRVQMKDQDQ